MTSTGNKPVLIAGPTASGKSALALALAQDTGGVIINADSMQVYRGLDVLTNKLPLSHQNGTTLIFPHPNNLFPFLKSRFISLGCY